MFERVGEGWMVYLATASPTWDAGDPRHNLGAEVSQRLRHLDLIIRQLQAAVRATEPDPAQTRDALEWGLANHPRLEAGEITVEEFVAGSRARMPLPRDWSLDPWDLVWIFTESFYFSAWRMVGVLNNGRTKNGKPTRDPDLAFPGLKWVEARDVRIVRNNLIEHPEEEGSRNFVDDA